MEVVRDRNDNCIIVCSIENLDPMGVHTGDSITVAPAQTLTDKEYQIMRDASIAVLRKIGVECGGSNVQFAVSPTDGRLLVIEMNPRVSRSSALASKATGFPIAKIAAKLAIGYTLDELRNDITGGATPASFEPTIDYVVTKIPRFTFEKFPGANDRLTTQMKSVGEVMAIGRTFQESLQKALRGLETGIDGLTPIVKLPLGDEAMNALLEELRMPGPDRLRYVADAFRAGLTQARSIARRASIPWFLAQIEDLVREEHAIERGRVRGARCGAPAGAEAQGLRRQPHREAGGHERAGGARAAARLRHPAGVQARRHLRGRVRDVHGLPLLDLRGGVRGGADRAAQDRDPGRRAEPHRPGHRVRLLLRARSARAARGRVRDHHGQLQPGDGLDRLRHLRPPVLRAAHVRGRDGDPARREAVRRDRAVRRPDAAQARQGARRRRRADHRHQPRFDRRRRGPRALPEARRPPAAAAAAEPDGAHRGRGGQARRARWVSRSWCVRHTCSAGARWKSSSRRTTCAPT